MKKAILAQKVLACVLAIGLGGFVLPLAAQANSGLSDEPQDVKGLSYKYYIGTNGAADNVVIIDSDLDHGVIGGFSFDGNATGNSVSISGSTTVVTGAVYGGIASGIAERNIVNMSGGEAGDVYGRPHFGAACNVIMTYRRCKIQYIEI